MSSRPFEDEQISVKVMKPPSNFLNSIWIFSFHSIYYFISKVVNLLTNQALPSDSFSVRLVFQLLLHSKSVSFLNEQ